MPLLVSACPPQPPGGDVAKARRGLHACMRARVRVCDEGVSVVSSAAGGSFDAVTRGPDGRWLNDALY